MKDYDIIPLADHLLSAARMVFPEYEIEIEEDDDFIEALSVPVPKAMHFLFSMWLWQCSFFANDLDKITEAIEKGKTYNVDDYKGPAAFLLGHINRASLKRLAHLAQQPQLVIQGMFWHHVDFVKFSKSCLAAFSDLDLFCRAMLFFLDSTRLIQEADYMETQLMFCFDSLAKPAAFDILSTFSFLLPYDMKRIQLQEQTDVIENFITYRLVSYEEEAVRSAINAREYYRILKKAREALRNCELPEREKLQESAIETLQRIQSILAFVGEDASNAAEPEPEVEPFVML